MTHFKKNAHGKYVVSGKTFEMLIGTRAQVWHGTAYKTSGGLTRCDLFQNKNGRIVSKAKHLSAKKEKRLVKAGYVTKKGKFGFVKSGKTAKTKKTRKSKYDTCTKKKGGRSCVKRGGMGALSPASISGIRGTSGVDVQLMATNY